MQQCNRIEASEFIPAVAVECIDNWISFFTLRVARREVDAIANFLIDELTVETKVLCVGRKAGL
jgi:hypothetical protein